MKKYFKHMLALAIMLVGCETSNNSIEKEVVSFDIDTNTLTFDFSDCVVDNKPSLSNFDYYLYMNNVLKIAPFHGVDGTLYPVKNVVFKSTFNNPNLTSNVFEDLSILFVDEWTTNVNITFNNFNFSNTLGQTCFDVSNVKSQYLTSIKCIGDNSINCHYKGSAIIANTFYACKILTFNI